jgi:hypothetical protein
MYLIVVSGASNNPLEPDRKEVSAGCSRLSAAG